MSEEPNPAEANGVLADGEVPYGTAFDPEAHNMTARLYRDDVLISQRQFVSGNISSGEFALAREQGLTQLWRVGDTESRAIRTINLQSRDNLVLDGQLEPCEWCQSAMIKRSVESGAEIQYRFLDETGNTRIWSARQRGYIYAGF